MHPMGAGTQALLWLGCGDALITGVSCVRGEIPPAAPKNAGPLLLQHSDEGVLKDALKAPVFGMVSQVLWFAWTSGASPWRWRAACCCFKPTAEQSSSLGSEANLSSSDISVN